MKRIFESRLLLNVAVLLLAAGLIFQPLVRAQQQSENPGATPVSSYGPPCSISQNTHSSATTLTITPPGGQYVYICEIDVVNCQGSAVTAAAPTYLTTTGINGTPQWPIGSGPATAGTCSQSFSVSYPNGGLRSATAGANVTVVTPTFVTNQVVGVNVVYRFGT